VSEHELEGADLTVDGGRAPRPREDEPELEPGFVEPVQPGIEPGLVVDEGWLPETVGGVMDGFALFANGITRARGGGPDDVFLLRPEDHRAIDGALARYLNRHAASRRLASQGDLAAAGVAFMAYASRETGRAAAFREAQQEGLEDLRAESPTASGLGVRIDPGGPGTRPPRRDVG
jgi:hypothetical protein